MLFEGKIPSALGVIEGAQLLLERARKYDKSRCLLSNIERQQQAEQVYWAAGEAMVQTQNLLSALADSAGFEKRTYDKIPSNTGKVEAYFEKFALDFPAFRCVFPSPPILKTKAATSKFFELFCLDLQRTIIKNLPHSFRKMESAAVVYVSHYAKDATHRQPYFDNDNLAIKAVLDSVVPYICFDDAANFCDNLYLSQPDEANFSELFVVRKAAFPHWVQAHQELEFCRNLASFHNV